MYSNLEEIDYNLERLGLERQIAYEKLKIVKDDYSEIFRPLSFIQSGLKFAGKYGIFYLIKKLIKR